MVGNVRVMTGGQGTIGGPTGKKPLITAEAPPAPGVPAHQGREGGTEQNNKSDTTLASSASARLRTVMVLMNIRTTFPLFPDQRKR